MVILLGVGFVNFGGFIIWWWGVGVGLVGLEFVWVVILVVGIII